VTHPQVLDALRGHLRWWYYELHGRDESPIRDQVRAEAAALAATWIRPERTDLPLAELPAHPCCDEPPLPAW
jgi:hypothetical protein